MRENADLIDPKKQIQQLRHIHFDRVYADDRFFPEKEIVAIAAKVADMTDSAIVEAIIEFAQKEGITDLYLMDKRFVMEALTEKLEREKQDIVTVVRCEDCVCWQDDPWSDSGEKVCKCWCDWLPTNADDFCSYGERKIKP